MPGSPAESAAARRRPGVFQRLGRGPLLIKSPFCCRFLGYVVAMTPPSIHAPAAPDPAELLGRLGARLIEADAIDQRTLDRARRVAGETGGRFDQVLTQLGLVSEKRLAEALALLLEAPLVGTGDYPEAPLFADRLKAKFLRKARALPIAATPDGLVLAMSDPLDEVAREATAAALDQPVKVAGAVPVVLEATVGLLYADAQNAGDAAEPLEAAAADIEPAQQDVDR